MAAKIRRNDEVIIIAGKDKGKRGKVVSILLKNRVIVEGVNMVKRHKRPVPSKNEIGGIIKKEAAIHISNVALFNKKLGKADRVGFKFELGKKIRFFKSNGEKVV